MNRKVFPGVVMKHTRYLVNGRFLSLGQEFSGNKYLSFLIGTLRILGSAYLLVFCLGLLPFAIFFDIGRILYASELRFNRKVSQVMETIRDGNGAISMLYRRGRYFYLLIRRPIHLYILNINSDARKTFSKFS